MSLLSDMFIYIYACIVRIVTSVHRDTFISCISNKITVNYAHFVPITLHVATHHRQELSPSFTDHFKIP